MLRVAADVAAELGVPELAVGFRTRRRRTGRGLHELSPVPLPAVLVPEAAANLDKGAALRNHDVGMADDAPIADSEAIAVRPEHLMDLQTWQT